VSGRSLNVICAISCSLSGEELDNADVAPVIGHAIGLLTASGEADVLFDRAIEIAIRWVRDNRLQLDNLISAGGSWDWLHPF
jgi:hypothetical protein